MKKIKLNNSLTSPHNKSNQVLVTRQIESLREVLRRMKASAKAAALDPIINRKLKQLLET